MKKNRIILRNHVDDDFSGNYLNWLVDSDVMEHTDTHVKKFSHDELKLYAKNEKEKGNIFLAVEDVETGEHIGNLKIYNISADEDCKSAEYSRFIGEKNFWGRGYGTELGLLAIEYCFNNLHLDKVLAGCRFENKKAIISNLKIGFEIEGVKFYKAENYQGEAKSLIFSITKEQFFQKKT